MDGDSERLRTRLKLRLLAMTTLLKTALPTVKFYLRLSLC